MCVEWSNKIRYVLSSGYGSCHATGCDMHVQYPEISTDAHTSSPCVRIVCVCVLWWQWAKTMVQITINGMKSRSSYFLINSHWVSESTMFVPPSRRKVSKRRIPQAARRLTHTHTHGISKCRKRRTSLRKTTQTCRMKHHITAAACGCKETHRKTTTKKKHTQKTFIA